MSSPPPVPPKDSPYTLKMDIDRPAPSSGSKRKRDVHDHTVYDYRNGRLEAVDPDSHTPKRSRSHLRRSDTDASDDAGPANQRSLRRKKKVNNLSSVNLRHAAEQQRQASIKSRGSKFQEGSLTDKPSMQPPSVFTRMIRTDSGNIKQVDELMEDYNKDEPQDTVEAAVDREMSLMSQRVEEITAAESVQREESGGFFRFGRSLAANFHPVSLWNKMWHETKVEMTRQNMEEAERKRRQKEEAEAKYAEMKQAGQLGLQPVSNLRTSVEPSAPRDSAIVMPDNVSTSHDHQRTISSGTQLLAPSKDDVSNHSGSEVAETASRPAAKTLKGRFHFKKPSMSDLKTGLKRVKSDFNLASAANANRESSSSVSPVKPSFEVSTLRKSYSRYDIKKQTKLSKRVSDLEVKLKQAREELSEALVEASPMPKLNNKYERFTPVSTLKRPKFVPGKLPTLHSQGVLNPEQLVFGDRDDEETPVTPGASEKQPSKALNQTSEAMDIDADGDGDNTIKASRARAYPPRADSLFKLTNDDTEPLPETEDKTTDKLNTQISELTKLTSDAINNMDPNNTTNFTSDGALEPAKSGDYASLDAKLKALDANVKAAKKSTKPKTKKRKSRANDDDALFKPGKETDDDAEWQEANETPKKRRKSSSAQNSSSPQTKKTRVGAGRQSSPQPKKAANGVGKKAGKAITNGKNGGKQGVAEIDDDEQFSEHEMSDADAGAEEPVDDAPSRTSMDSQGLPLEPLYEEEEETSMVALKDEPSKPTAMATPARYGRHAVKSHSRSTSPNKRSAESVQPAAEEQMITRAAEAARHGRLIGRSVSPPPVNGHSKVVTVVEETVSIVPGESDVPNLPKGANGDFESLAADETVEKKVVVKKVTQEEFEWPEDVF